MWSCLAATPSHRSNRPGESTLRAARAGPKTHPRPVPVALRAVSKLRYRRVVVKLSGRAFAGVSDFGLDNHALGYVADQLIAARVLGIQQAVVVGGGNFFRGNVADDWSIERAEADNIGMLGTVMNGILMRGVLKHRGLEDVRLMTAVPIQSVAEPFIRLRAISHLEREHLVLLAAGIGQPYVTTDYASVQRAIEVRAEAILLAKHGVDGIYDSDPADESERDALRLARLQRRARA